MGKVLSPTLLSQSIDDHVCCDCLSHANEMAIMSESAEGLLTALGRDWRGFFCDLLKPMTRESSESESSDLLE